MDKPALMIMAAGIGSRFGGLKQLAPVGKNGEPILMFSLYDAIEAGFTKVVFIIKKEIDSDFKELIGDSLRNKAETEYVYQELDMLPPGFFVPEGRIKPWGTGHAVLCAKDVLKGPFAVINADDFYGKDAFHIMHDYLLSKQNDDAGTFSMIGYLIENTLTENGHVARGVCRTEKGFLTAVDERLRIEKHGNLIEYTEDDGETWEKIEPGTLVSMNFWGFSQRILAEIETGFPAFLSLALEENPIKGEYLLPRIVNTLLWEQKVSVEVLHSKDEWYGVTYRDDLPKVAAAIRSMQDDGRYPEVLF